MGIVLTKDDGSKEDLNLDLLKQRAYNISTVSNIVSVSIESESSFNNVIKIYNSNRISNVVIGTSIADTPTSNINNCQINGENLNNVVIKIYKHNINNTKVRLRVLRELLISSRIYHPNLVYIYGFTFVDSGLSVIDSSTPLNNNAKFCTIMTKYDTDLFNYISVTKVPLVSNSSQIDGETKKRILLGPIYKGMFKICKAITYLHDLNIMHRDIKPLNILLRFKDQCRVIKDNTEFVLTDFDSSRELANDMIATAVGTNGFIAPEIYKAVAERRAVIYNKYADIYSFGVTIVHAIMMIPVADLIANINMFDKHKDTAFPRYGNKSSPDYVISQCFNTDVSKRPGNVDLQKALHDASLGKL